MMFYKLSAAIAAFAFSGNIDASPCKPFSQSTAIVLETPHTTQTSTIESSPATFELSSSATTFPWISASSSEAIISSFTLSFETSVAVDETIALIASTTELSTFDTTTAITESLSETATTTDVSATTEASIATTAYTTTDSLTIEATASSSAPQCTFTGEYTNYVQNPSFDNKVSGNWVTTSPWIFLQTPWLAPNAGRGTGNAIAIKYPDGMWSSAILQSLEGVVAGREYVLRYYWSLEGHPLQSDECRIGASAGSLGQTMHFIYTDGEEPVQQGQYYMQEFHITADQDDQRLAIGFFCKAGYDGDEVRVYIDDVSVYDYYEGCETSTDAVVERTR